eukprot:9096058-Pyramimonas_sp.AAC.1
MMIARHRARPVGMLFLNFAQSACTVQCVPLQRYGSPLSRRAIIMGDSASSCSKLKAKIIAVVNEKRQRFTDTWPTS